jgi:hypothetical protein
MEMSPSEMSEDQTNKNMTLAAPESQSQRWIKYGANVVFSSLIVILLAVMLTWLAQSHAVRVDTTAGGTQSLRPQSVNFIQDLKQPIRIVALYPKLKSDSHEQDYYQPVADLLNEYATKGKNIRTELLDPDTEKDEFNKLVSEVTNKYGGAVQGYKAILDKLPNVNKTTDQFVTDEAAKFRALPFDKVQDQQLQQEISAAYLTLVLAHHQIDDLKTAVDSELNQQIPSYKDGVDDARTTYTNISGLLQQFSQVVASFKTNPAFAKLTAITDYAIGAATRADNARKDADALVDGIAHLGALTELDEFKQQLKSKAIIVMGDSGYKILQFDQIWKVPEASRFTPQSPDVQPRLSFAGEQQITAAIASLTSAAKPMVVFVRNGGAPVATAMSPDQQPLFASIAQRLRDQNFDVQEKDATGQSAMQENPIPEPTDAQMKSAIWVVIRSQHDTQPDQPSQIDPMLEQHLQSGGSALVLLFPTADTMDQAVSIMGIHARTDELIVHESLAAPERQSNDFAESAFQSSQAVFRLNQYGDHPIATPLAGLDFLQAASSPISVGPDIPPGVHATGLLPMPLSPHYWASSDTEAILNNQGGIVTFNPKPDPDAGRMFGDVDNTAENRLYGAAASEAPSGSRLVVVGSYVFAISYLVDLPDQEMLERHGLNVSRLPGNGEFFVNSILWLAHEDSMLAISPHALQVARIREMTPATLAFWRLGVLTAALPLAVIFAGLMVYSRRRD